MKVTPLSEVQPRPRRVAVGTFDGVHLGHRRVIEGADTVLTFDPHPTSITAPEHAPRLLTTLPEKAELLEQLGVREMVVIPFNQAFSERPPDAFVDDVLVGALRATDVSVGENFRFGCRAQGNPALLAADARFRTRVHALREVDGEVVSSSHIRALVTAGEVERAAHFLGRPFTVRGEVVHGDARGRTLGFPTANLIPQEHHVTPGHGVYAALADDVPAAVSIGVRPTFGLGRIELIEAYLLDFDEDLYGRELVLRFLERLRGEKRFDTVEELLAQMDEDVERTREVVARATR